MSQGFVTLEGDEIVIRLTAAANASAWESGMWAHCRSGLPQESMPPITDKQLFLKEVFHWLMQEEENGDTAVHRMFDQVFREIYDYGCEGIDWEATDGVASTSKASDNTRNNTVGKDRANPQEQ